MSVPGRTKKERPRRRRMDLAREDMERVELRREAKSIGSNGKYFRAVATPNREKPKEEVYFILIIEQLLIYIVV